MKNQTTNKSGHKETHMDRLFIVFLVIGIIAALLYAKGLKILAVIAFAGMVVALAVYIFFFVQNSRDRKERRKEEGREKGLFAALTPEEFLKKTGSIRENPELYMDTEKTAVEILKYSYKGSTKKLYTGTPEEMLEKAMEFFKLDVIKKDKMPGGKEVWSYPEAGVRNLMEYAGGIRDYGNACALHITCSPEKMSLVCFADQEKLEDEGLKGKLALAEKAFGENENGAFETRVDMENGMFYAEVPMHAFFVKPDQIARGYQGLYGGF